jgi:hypothetical protein
MITVREENVVFAEYDPAAVLVNIGVTAFYKQNQITAVITPDAVMKQITVIVITGNPVNFIAKIIPTCTWS